MKKEINTITTDVLNLYPYLKRILIKTVEHYLNIRNNYNNNQQNIIIDTIIFCSENNYVSFNHILYKNNQGIPTRKSFSVLLANISLHFLNK